MITALVPREGVIDVWPKVLPFLEKAIERFPGRYEAIDIYTEIQTGRLTLWIAFNEDKEIKSFAILRIIEYPLCKSLLFEWLGGEGIDEWLDGSLDVISNFARDNGCKFIETRARDGFWPRFKKQGWKKVAAFFEYELER